MLFSKNRFMFMFLALSLAVGQVSAGSSYFSQAKQKAQSAKNWSARTAKSSYAKASNKARSAYAFAYKKARAAYEKAKEHKKLVIGAAYVLFEAFGHWKGWRTPFKRLFVIPGELDAANANNATLNTTNVNLNTTNTNLAGQLNTANANIANLNNNVAHLAGQLNVVNINNDNLDNAVDGHVANIADLNDRVTDLVGQLDLSKKLGANIGEQLNVANLHRANLKDQLNVANANNFGLQNKINEAQQQLVTLNQELENKKSLDAEMELLADELLELNSQVEALNVQMAQSEKDAQLQAEAQQVELDKNEKTILTFQDEQLALLKKRDRQKARKEDLKKQIDLLNQQMAQSKADAQLRAEVQYRELGNAREQGKAEVLFGQQHDGIKNALVALGNEIQASQVVDAPGIINDLMVQAQALIECRDTMHKAYPINQDKQVELVRATFNNLVDLAQQTVNHVINKIDSDAAWLNGEVAAMNFANVNADNFDAEIEYIYADIDNFFGQLNYSLEQLNWIEKLKDKNEIVCSCLSSRDATHENSIVQALGGMISASLEKIQTLSSQQQENDKIVAKSHDDAFNIYAHTLVAHHAYESYVKFCQTMPASEYSQQCLDWANQFEQHLAFITHCVWGGNVHVEASFDGMSSIGDMQFLQNLNSSMVGMLQTSTLNRSDINNFSLSAFLANPVNSASAINDLTQSMLAASGFGKSSLWISGIGSKMDNLDELWNFVNAQNKQEWQQELSAMNKSAIDFNQSFTASRLSNSSLGKSMKSTLGFLTSSFFGNRSSMDKSALKSDSVIQFASRASSVGCPFVSADKYQEEIEKLAQSGRFNNRENGMSRLPHVPVNLQSSAMDASHVGINNNLANLTATAIIAAHNVNNGNNELGSPTASVIGDQNWMHSITETNLNPELSRTKVQKDYERQNSFIDGLNRASKDLDKK